MMDMRPRQPRHAKVSERSLNPRPEPRCPAHTRVGRFYVSRAVRPGGRRGSSEGVRRDGPPSLALSQRRDPSLLRAWGGALLGAKLAGRWAGTFEGVSDPQQYEVRRNVDWAYGAVLLSSRRCVDAVGIGTSRTSSTPRRPTIASVAVMPVSWSDTRPLRSSCILVATARSIPICGRCGPSTGCVSIVAAMDGWRHGVSSLARCCMS